MDQTLKATSSLGKPVKRTRQEALAAGERVQRKQSKPNEEPFVSVTPFSELLESHDVTKHSKTDLAHTFANAVKMLSNAATNQTSDKSRVAFGKKQREFEVQRLRRFLYLNDKVLNDKGNMVNAR
jgi:hypothetical protein